MDLKQRFTFRTDLPESSTKKPSGLQPPRIHFPKANKQCCPLVLVGGYYSRWSQKLFKWRGNSVERGGGWQHCRGGSSWWHSGVHKSCWFSSGNTGPGIMAVVIVRLIKLCRGLQWPHRLLLTRFFLSFTFLRIKGNKKPISVRLP